MLLALLLAVAAPAFAAHAAATEKHASAASHKKAEKAAAKASPREGRAGVPARAAASSRKSRGAHEAASEAPARGRSRHSAAVSAVGYRSSRRRGRLNPRLNTIALGSPVGGSHDSLVRQNVKVNEDGLERIENDEQLDARIASKALVPVPASDELAVNPSLPENRRYCRPWTATFLADLAKAHAEVFHGALLVSSAVRTVQFQKKLRHHNRNAAPAVGEITSPHLTGATVDIAKSPLTPQEKEWMRGYLLTLQNQGKIDAEEEFREACFHITVYKAYAEPEFDVDAPLEIPVAAMGESAEQGR
jgi:hypothetical protein